jgi:predicted ArsR family transcriptional regulator
MSETKLDTRFFESTRGQIVMLLRDSAKTVNEIADMFDLTDNAIRSHLLSLERDSLVEQKGVTKGFRKPHNLYGLTAEARHLFPKPYAYLFNKLIDVLKKRSSGVMVENILRDVGREVGNEKSPDDVPDLDARLGESLKILEALGGAAKVIRENDKITIKSESCPFTEAVSEHPEICKVAEAMIEEIVERPVKEVCDRANSPKCCFEIDLREHSKKGMSKRT